MRENDKKRKAYILIICFVLGMLEIGCVVRGNNQYENIGGFIEKSNNVESAGEIENSKNQETDHKEMEFEDKQQYLKDELEKYLKSINDENLVIQEEYRDKFPAKDIEELEKIEMNVVLDFLDIRKWNAPPFEEEDSLNLVDEFLGKYNEDALSLYTEQKPDITIDAYVGNYCPTRNFYSLDVCHVIKVYENGKITELGYDLYNYSSADYIFAPEIQSKYLCTSVKECNIFDKINEGSIQGCWFTEMGYDLIFKVNTEIFYVVCNQNDEIQEIYSLIEND